MITELTPDRKTTDQLEHSRLLDVHRWSDHPEVNGFCTDIWERYFYQTFEPAGKGNRPKKHPKYQLKVLLLDLYIAWKTDPELLISLSFTKNAYRGSTRYNKLHISYVIVELAYHALDVGLIGRHKGSEASGLVSRIWPTSKLLDYFNRVDFDLYQLEYSSDQEVICLSKAKDSDTHDLQLVDNEDGKEKTPLKYAEYDDRDAPAEISKWRELLHNYNRLLSNTFVDIGSLESPSVKTTYWDKKAKRERTRTVFIGQHNKYVKRIFYRNDWSLGGRIHGGWWQQVKSDYRKHILINDQPTDEQDYSGLHITLLYALKGIQPPSDPYSLNYTTDLTSAAQRSVVKQLVLLAINMSPVDGKRYPNGLFTAFRLKQPSKSEAKGLNNEVLTDLLDAFCLEHPSIEPELCSDKGVALMNIDGNITMRVLEYFTNKSIPVLTIHDSYILDIQHQSDLHKVMTQAIEIEVNSVRNMDMATPAYFKFKSTIKPTYVPQGLVSQWVQTDRWGDHSDLQKRTNPMIKVGGYQRRCRDWQLSRKV